MQVHVPIDNGSKLPHGHCADEGEENQHRVGVKHNSAYEKDDEERPRDGTYD